MIADVRILDARPAPRYIRLPAQVPQALAAGEIGRGELVTAVLLYHRLWGSQQPLEGTTEEFAAVLGVDARSLQRHLPALGQSGCVLYGRPQRGYWSVSAPTSPAEAAASSLSPPTVLSLGHVVVLDPPESESDSQTPEQQQQVMVESAAPATKLSPAATKLSPARLDVAADLVEIGFETGAAAALAAEHRPARLRQLIRIALNDRSILNPAGWIRTALAENWQIARDDPRGRYDPDPADYVSGRYADLIQR